MSGSHIEELGKMMDSQMKHIVKKNLGITVELGTINQNMALSISSLGNAIPKGDYMISRHLLNESMELDTSTKEDHKHTVTLPNKLRGLQKGDRVLVAWVGTEPVVIDIVVSS